MRVVMRWLVATVFAAVVRWCSTLRANDDVNLHGGVNCRVVRACGLRCALVRFSIYLLFARLLCMLLRRPPDHREEHTPVAHTRHQKSAASAASSRGTLVTSFTRAMPRSHAPGLGELLVPADELGQRDAPGLVRVQRKHRPLRRVFFCSCEMVRAGVWVGRACDMHVRIHVHIKRTSKFGDVT